MQELAIAVYDCPDQASSVKQQTGPGQEVAQQQLIERGLIAIGAGDLELPGLHRQGMAMLMPIPNEVGAKHEENMQHQNRAGQHDLISEAQCEVWQHETDRENAEQQQ